MVADLVLLKALLEDLPWRPSFNGRECVKKEDVPCEVRELFISRRVRLVGGWWYYVRSMSGRLFRRKFCRKDVKAGRRYRSISL